MNSMQYIHLQAVFRLKSLNLFDDVQAAFKLALLLPHH